MTINEANIFTSSLDLTTSYDISLKPFCKEYLIELAKNLREEDWQEMWACYHLPAEKALLLCVQKSLQCWTLLYRRKVVAMAGIEPLSVLGNKACIWSWTSNEIFHCSKSFLRASKNILNQCRRLYSSLYAACDRRYLAANRYLRYLGACPIEQYFYLADQKTQFILYQWI